MESRLKLVQTDIEALAKADEAATPDARAALAKSLHALLLDVASRDVEEATRREIDMSLSEEAVALKGALFKALKLCKLHRAFLGLPALKEETRKLLAAAPAKGVSTYLETELCKDIDECKEPRALIAVREVHEFFTGVGRLKKACSSPHVARHAHAASLR